MNYIGSKVTLLEFLDKYISEIVDSKAKIFCDLFAGTGVVGVHFKKKGYKIISNDFQYYSYILNKHYIENNKILTFKLLCTDIPALVKISPSKRKDFICSYLTNLSPQKGFIYNNYSLGGTNKQKYPRQYFSDYNAGLCDAIRQKIENWKKQKLISDNEYYFLLASLIESIDKYANTASVYGAFLKKIKQTAKEKLVMCPSEFIKGKQKNLVFNLDSNNLINKIKGDILYLDPPYNARQYSNNYHLLETIAKYDDPQIKGLTGVRFVKTKSLFCAKNKVLKSFSDLIKKSNFKYIFLSYNNEGLLSLAEIKKVLSARGTYGLFTIKHKRFKSDLAKKRKYGNCETIEYLHYVIVNDQKIKRKIC